MPLGNGAAALAAAARGRAADANAGGAGAGFPQSPAEGSAAGSVAAGWLTGTKACGSVLICSHHGFLYFF